MSSIIQHLNSKLKNTIAEATQILFYGPSKDWVKRTAFSLVTGYYCYICTEEKGTEDWSLRDTFLA